MFRGGALRGEGLASCAARCAADTVLMQITAGVKYLSTDLQQLELRACFLPIAAVLQRGDK